MTRTRTKIKLHDIVGLSIAYLGVIFITAVSIYTYSTQGHLSGMDITGFINYILGVI